MNYRHFKYEGWLYALALLFAILLRFAQLDAFPLTDVEAAPALQALQVSQGLKPALDQRPFYILSTAVLFFIYGGGTDFLARLIPALAGSLLILAPLLFADRLKPRVSVALAFFLALDPGLVALSRQVASPILALTFLLFALGFYNQRKPRLAAALAAFAVLSGAAIWIGILGLAIAWGILRFLNSRRPQPAPSDLESSPADPQPSTFNFQPSSLARPFIFTFLLAGSLFFLVPNGLSAALASIPNFLSNWFAPSIFPPGRLLFSLPFYQPLGILLAVFAMARGWKNGSPRIIALSLWLFAALLLAVVYPSRQMGDLAWALIPLWALAALELVRNVDIFVEERGEVAGVILLTAFIWTFAWLDFAGLTTLLPESREYIMRFWLLVGSLFLLAMSLLLVAAGWSIRVARIGGIWGLALTLGTLGVSGAFGAAGLRGYAFPELWWLAEQPLHARLLASTVSDVSEWGLGNDYAAKVTIAGLDSPALEWILRERQVSVVQILADSASPEIVITPFQDNPQLSSAYRGQDFAWRQTPLWDTNTAQNWIRWAALREMPTSGETLILWVRDDLFLNSNTPR